jgi:hypothetical protein
MSHPDLTDVRISAPDAAEAFTIALRQYTTASDDVPDVDTVLSALALVTRVFLETKGAPLEFRFGAHQPLPRLRPSSVPPTPGRVLLRPSNPVEAALRMVTRDGSPVALNDQALGFPTDTSGCYVMRVTRRIVTFGDVVLWSTDRKVSTTPSGD